MLLISCWDLISLRHEHQLGRGLHASQLLLFHPLEGVNRTQPVVGCCLMFDADYGNWKQRDWAARRGRSREWPKHWTEAGKGRACFELLCPQSRAFESKEKPQHKHDGFRSVSLVTVANEMPTTRKKKDLSQPSSLIQTRPGASAKQLSGQQRTNENETSTN